MTTTSWDDLAKQLDDIEKPVSTLKLCKDTAARERYLTAQHAADESDRDLKQFSKDGTYDADALAFLTRQAEEAKTELASARKAYEAKTITLRFAALERKQLETLQNQHPASEEDEERGNDYALDTFAPALISAASLDGMPVEAARAYLDTWSSGDARDLWQAAWNIQHQKRTDLGKG